MNIDKLKKDDLLAYARKLVQENKTLKKQLENSSSVDESNLNDFALSYRIEEIDGKKVHVAYAVKCNLDNLPKVDKVVESTKELALYKLEMKIVDHFINQ